MTNLDKWRAYVEAHKFTGPTIKVLKLDDDTFAVMDHEYNLKSVVSTISLGSAVAIIQHPPQRERPRPILPAEEPKLTSVNLIEVGDLDL